MTERESWYKERYDAVEQMRRRNKRFRIYTLVLSFVFLPISFVFLIDVVLRFSSGDCSFGWFLLVVLANCLVVYQFFSSEKTHKEWVEKIDELEGQIHILRALDPNLKQQPSSRYPQT